MSDVTKTCGRCGCDDPNGEHIFNVAGCIEPLQKERDEARALNAQLLAALKDLADIADAWACYDPMRMPTKPHRALIAKAEGRES